MAPAPSGTPNDDRRTPAERIARALAWWAGSTWAFWFAVVFVGLWIVSGPLIADWGVSYRLMDQLTTGITFLMLFVLQRSQNKDTLALQLKLNELVASNPHASNRVLNAEEISDDELRRIRRHFQLLDQLSRRSGGADPLDVEEAYRRHAEEERRKDAAAAESAITGPRSVAGGPPPSAG